MSNQKATLVVILIGLFYGSTLVASRFGLRQFNPVPYTALRLLLASSAYLVILTLTRRRLPRVPAFWLWSILVGLTTVVLPMLCNTTSLLYQSSGVTGLLLTLTPVITVCMAQIFLPGEPFTLQKISGALVAFTGAALLLASGETGIAELARASWQGYILVFIALLANSSGFVIVRKRMSQADPITYTAISTFFATLVMVALAFLTTGFDFSRARTSGYAVVIYTSLIGTFSAQLLRNWLNSRTSAALASATELVVPVASVSLGALLLGEQVTWIMLIGMGLIMSGVLLLNQGAAVKSAAAKTSASS
ncbi:MAG TPA: DMT family transporter [Anaerolineaceae bacterium]